MNLRAIEPEDLEWIQEMRNSREVYSHVRERRLLTEADQRLWYEGLATDGNRRRYYVWTEYDHRGIVGLTNLDWLNRSGEVALMTDPLGAEPDALTVLVDHAFNVLGLHRLYTDTITDRRAQVFQAAGFQEEGLATQAYWRDGQWISARRWFRLATHPASGPQTPAAPLPG